MDMADRRREWLLVRAPGAPDGRFELAQSPLRIGRGRGNQIVLRDEYVSTTHAEIVERDGRRYVRDLGSTNGTELNGGPLAPDTPILLGDGDTLQIGSCTLIYRAGAPAESVAISAPTQTDGGRSSEAARPPAAAARRRGLAPRLLRSMLVILAALVILAGAAWALAPPRVSLLVLGSDARPDEVRRGEPGRTDTLMTVVADRPPAGAAIVSLPRDLWVGIPGYGQERINVAYALGGPEVAKRAVGDALGIRVGPYLLVGLQGVRDIVDAAGGVEIDVDAPIHDDAYPTDDYRTIVVDIPAGRQRMDGETALRYARTRHQDSDFGRIARQQRVLLALRNRMLQPGNWWRMPAVLDAVRRTTRTDLGPLDLVGLGVSLIGSPTEPERLAIGPPLVEPFSGTDEAYLLRPTPALRRSVAILLAPSEAAVEVLNATPSAGLAKQAADTLRGRGLQSVRYGDAGRFQPRTTVEARPGAGRAGRQVAAYLELPPALVSESASLPDDVDVRVTLGDRS